LPGRQVAVRTGHVLAVDIGRLATHRLHRRQPLAPTHGAATQLPHPFVSALDAS
jgi:hypothetical protein